MKRYDVFFDFDNTITTFDVIDDMLIRFSKDDSWLELERKWKRGLIGSRECLEGQVKGIRISKPDLDKYLRTIELDPDFKKLINFLKSKDIKTLILTDNFDYIVRGILKHKRIQPLGIYSNSLKIRDKHLIPSFPLTNKNHGKRCGHCKKATLLKNLDKDSVNVYVGDGLSDVCPSEVADIVFAKGNLKKYLKKKGIAFHPFRDFKDIYNYFRKELQ